MSGDRAGSWLTDVAQVDQAVLADVGAGAGLRPDDGAAALFVADDAELRGLDATRQVHVEHGAQLLQQLRTHKHTQLNTPAVGGASSSDGVRSHVIKRDGKQASPAAPPGAHLGVEAAGGLQEQRQIGLDLAAVGVGPILGLALQGGDLVLKGMVPPAGRQKTWRHGRRPTPTNQLLPSDRRPGSLQVLLHLLVQSVLQVRHQHLLVQVLQRLPGRPHLRRPQLGV